MLQQPKRTRYWLTVDEAAKRLYLSKQQVLNRVSDDTLTGLKTRGRMLVQAESVERLWIAMRRDERVHVR